MSDAVIYHAQLFHDGGSQTTEYPWLFQALDLDIDRYRWDGTLGWSPGL